MKRPNQLSFSVVFASKLFSVILEILCMPYECDVDYNSEIKHALN